MCGIIGFYTEKKTAKNIRLLKKLIEETSIRGLHSFGIAYKQKNQKKIIIKKEPFLDVNQLLSGFVKTKAERLIFHSRYSTSGDFKIPSNNQPILVNNTALVLNGIISMEEKKDYEKIFRVKCQTANDAEIILSQPKKYKEFLKLNPLVSFAGIFLKDKITALRNNKRPLYMLSAMGAQFFISTIDIAYRSGINRRRVLSIPPIKEVSI